MRSFVAIPVPETAVPALGDVQDAIEVGRVVASENWHLTLAFLGDAPIETLERLDERLHGLSVPAFDMCVAGIDIFGGRRPRVLYAGVVRSEPLARLRQKVRAAVRAAGIHLPRERFRPHVTLARFPARMTVLETQRIAGVLEGWADLDAGRVAVEAFSLYRSRLGPGGPDYELLAEYPLGQP
ncbi:MAG: RNA 2',3'-cyclic phosphodiesterase [Roseovarius sp.]|nr:RNA 2',3'-cyclic phosphodiesterase [Roseovarius sp.]